LIHALQPNESDILYPQQIVAFHQPSSLEHSFAFVVGKKWGKYMPGD
jgi:hypothetical protein